MTRRKIPSMVMSFDDRARLVNFFTLLITIDTRVRRTKKRAKNSRKAKTKGPQDGPLKAGLVFTLYYGILKTSLTTCSLELKERNRTNKRQLASMIDTISIILHSHEFTNIDPDIFNPSATLLLKQHSKQLRSLYAKYNPSKQELKDGIYKPRLTLAHRFNLNRSPELILKIELSLPKLLFGNNFEELRYKDFDHIITPYILAYMNLASSQQPRH